MAYNAKQVGTNYQVYDQNNQPVAYGTADILANYSLSPTQLTGSSPFTSQNWATGGTATPAPYQAPINNPFAPNNAMTYGAVNQQPQQTNQSPQTMSPQAQPPQSTNTAQPTSSQPAQQGQQQPLVMPASGSVVDLLNMAGVDSSQANRKLLAQQYGVQGYDFSAAKNKELADKYIAAYNAKRETKAPETEADARSQVQQQMADMASAQGQDAEATFFDQYSMMNPVVKSLYDAINQELSTPVTTQSFKDEYAKLTSEQGIPGLQMELMNMKNIMDGTEDDIRTEITKAGGFATESQVAALSGARNKVLLKQAVNLQNQLAIKEDYVDRLMEFSKLDRAEVEKQVDRKLNLREKMFSLQEKITSAARDNYQKIVDKVGYQGLAGLFGGNKEAASVAEQSLGIPKGSLTNPSALKFLSSSDKKLQFISGTANQRPGVFDPATGSFTPVGGSATGGGGSTYSNLPASIRQSADSLMDAANNLASSFGTKFQKDAFMGQVDALLDKGQTQAAAELIFSRAIQQIPDAEQRKKVTGRYEMVKRLNQIESLLGDYYAKGGTTGYFKGTNQQIQERFGQVGDKELARIGITIANAMDELLRFRTGAALTKDEENFYNRILPGVWKSSELNDAVIGGLRDSLQFDVENSLQSQLTVDGYRQVTDALMKSAMGMQPIEPSNSREGVLPNGTKVTQLPNGDIVDAQGNKYDQEGNRITGVSPSIPWGSLNLKK